MRVMITGGTGFIGGHVLKGLINAGHEPIALVRSKEKLDVVREIHRIDAEVACVEGDILDRASVEAAVSGTDACIHAAAFTTLDPAEMPRCLEVNAPGTKIVLDAALAAGCDPVVHISSSSCIFPTVGDLADPDIDPVHSSEAPYPKSKADSELYARSLQEAGSPVVTLYPAGATGPDDAGLNVLSMMLASILSEDYLMSAETGGWSLFDVRDLGTALAQLLTPGEGPRRYMCGGHMVGWSEFADTIARVTGKERALYPMTRDQLLENMDEEAVDIMLGIKPGNDAPLLDDSGLKAWRPLDETLRDTIQWLIEHGHLDAAAAPALAG